MNPEFWAIIGVGVALAGLQWRLYVSLNANLSTRMDRIETRIDRIETRIDQHRSRPHQHQRTPFAHRRLDRRTLRGRNRTVRIAQVQGSSTGTDPARPKRTAASGASCANFATTTLPTDTSRQTS